MATAEAALARLRDPAAEVSAHYLLAEDGRVWQLVEETRRAWHAGRSHWAGEDDVNSASIGIELANPGIGAAAHPFPEPQMAALETLLRGVVARWGIRPERVVGHACVAPGRKVDPGPRFDWRRLARRGLAVWAEPGATGLEAPPEPPHRPHPPTRTVGGLGPSCDEGVQGRVGPSGPPPDRAPAAEFQAQARIFGYGAPATGIWDAPTNAVWRAFALRFRPAEAAGPATPDGLAQLARLAERWPAASLGH